MLAKCCVLMKVSLTFTFILIIPSYGQINMSVCLSGKVTFFNENVGFGGFWRAESFNKHFAVPHPSKGNLVFFL